MKNNKSPNPSRTAWTRLAGATLICLLILAATIPSLGRVDRLTHTARYGWADALSIAIIVAPVILIFVGAAGSWRTEGVGWAFLISLLALRFIL